MHVLLLSFNRILENMNIINHSQPATTYLVEILSRPYQENFVIRKGAFQHFRVKGNAQTHIYSVAQAYYILQYSSIATEKHVAKQ